MIDSCPTLQSSGPPPFKQGQLNMNNIGKRMVKGGVIMDLVRVPHTLALSSPSMAATINAALNPLETLTRILN